MNSRCTPTTRAGFYSVYSVEDGLSLTLSTHPWD